MDRDQLRAAVDAGIISAEQARQMEARLRSPGDGEGEGESLKFLSNLNDIFLSIGIVILFLGLIAASSILSFGAVTYKHLTPMIFLPLAGIAWLLAEYFTARRKMLLPSIVLASGFSLFIAIAILSVSAWTQVEDSGAGILGQLRNGGVDVDGSVRQIGENVRSSYLIGCLAGFVAALGFYLRFRLPFAMFIMAGCVTLAVFSLALGYTTLMVMGLVTLCAAIYFDAKDPERRTRVSDNGFWLHVAAAPQLVYGLRGTLDLGGSASDSVIMIAIMAALAILSLLLNRRALILSGLLSFGFAVWTLFQAFGDGMLMTLAAPFLFLGGLIVLLGSGWRSTRLFLLQVFPSTGIWSRIFPPEPRLNV